MTRNSQPRRISVPPGGPAGALQHNTQRYMCSGCGHKSFSLNYGNLLLCRPDPPKFSLGWCSIYEQ